MKRLAFKTIALFAILMMMATTAFAFSSATGSVIDSKDKQPWRYGGEVWVYDTASGDICGTTILDANGQFSVRLNGTQNDLNAGTLHDCTNGYNGNTLEILIDFNCGMGVGTCNPPNGYPGTNSTQFTQNTIPVAYNAGYIETGTGPTAILLDNFSAQSSVQWPLIAGVALLALAGGGFAVARRKEWL